VNCWVPFTETDWAAVATTTDVRLGCAAEEEPLPLPPLLLHPGIRIQIANKAIVSVEPENPMYRPALSKLDFFTTFSRGCFGLEYCDPSFCPLAGIRLGREYLRIGSFLAGQEVVLITKDCSYSRIGTVTLNLLPVCSLGADVRRGRTRLATD